MLVGVRTMTRTLMQVAQSHVSAVGLLKSYSKPSQWKLWTTAELENKAYRVLWTLSILKTNLKPHVLDGLHG